MICHRPASPDAHAPRAFTLVELLVVMAIIVVMLGLIGPVVNGLRGARDITEASYEIMGTLEQARTYAIATNTYVFVGFFEESIASATFPRVAGVGRVVVCVVASRDGSRVYSTATSNPTRLDVVPATLTPLTKLLKFDNLHLERLPDSALTRPAPILDQYHVGHADFASRPLVEGSTSLQPNAATFNYPPGTSTASAQYTFQKIIQFSPQGDATKIADVPTRLMEIGLRATHGATPDMASPNVIALQIAGIASEVKIYRK